MIAAGSHIGGYHIQRLLGRGAMGEVYLAEQVSLRRPVALKRIAGHLLDNEDAIARFEREAQCIARITSQHVVMVHDFGRFRDESGEEHYLLVMELVEGGTSLADCIAEPVDWRLATSVIRQMAEGLAAAAEQDVIHRDIKPGNVMLSSRGVAKLCDFGLARALDSTAMTMEGSLLGTPLYMSPEACRGESVGPASDIYSLGVTWYQMLAGVPPFSAGNMMALLRMHLEEQPQPLAEIAPETPPQVLSLVEQCMAKDLSLRIDSARRLDQAIQALATEGLVVPQRVEDLVAASGARSAAPSTLATMLTDPGAATATVPGGASAPAASAETIAGQTLGPEDPAPDPALTVAPAGPPTAATQLPPPAPERRGSRVPVIAAVLALVAAGVGVALWRPWQAADAPAPAMMPPAAPDAQGSQARSPEPDPGDGRERDPGDGPVDPDPASVGAEQMASDPAVAVITAVEQAVEAGDPLAARLRLDALDSDHPRYAQVAQAVVALEQEQAAAAAREQALAAIEAALAAAEPQRARALLEQHATKLDPAQRERMTASVDQLAARQARQRAVSDVEEALADGDVEQARSRLAAQAETIGADARAQLAEQIDALAVEQARARAREQARVAEAARQKQIAQITAALEAGELERARELLAGLDDGEQRAELVAQLASLEQAATDALAAEAEAKRQAVATAIDQRKPATAAAALAQLPEDEHSPELAARIEALAERQRLAWELIERKREELAYQKLKQLLPHLATYPELEPRAEALGEEIAAAEQEWDDALARAEDRAAQTAWVDAGQALAAVPTGEAALGAEREQRRAALAERIGAGIQPEIDERMARLITLIRAKRYAEARGLSTELLPLAELAGQGERIERLIARLDELQQTGEPDEDP